MKHHHLEKNCYQSNHKCTSTYTLCQRIDLSQARMFPPCRACRAPILQKRKDVGVSPRLIILLGNDKTSQARLQKLHTTEKGVFKSPNLERASISTP